MAEYGKKKKKEIKTKEDGRGRPRKKGSGRAIGTVLAVAGVVTIISVIAIFLGIGQGKSHASGIDFSNYTWWWIFTGFFPVVVGAAFAFGGMMAARRKYAPKGISYGGKMAFFGLFLLVGIGAFLVTATGASAVRAYMDNSKVAQIEIVDADSGDFTVLGATVKSYHEVGEGSLYDNLRFMQFDDRYQIAMDINCTNFTAADGNATQLYNSTTVTVKGYNVAREAVTGLLAPEVQPGDYTITSNAITVVVSGIPRQIASPGKEIAYLEVLLLDEDGDTLGTWIIHTHPDLDKWVVKSTF